MEKRDLIDALLKKEHDQPSADQDKEHDQTSTSKSQEKKNSDHKHKDHLGFTKVCVIKLNLKKSKSYHIILKTNVSSLFLSIQDIVWNLRNMAGHGNRGLYLPENMLVKCEEKHAVVVILNAWIKTVHLWDIIRKKIVCSLIHRKRHVAPVEYFDYMFLEMLSKSRNSMIMKTWLRISMMVFIPV